MLGDRALARCSERGASLRALCSSDTPVDEIVACRSSLAFPQFAQKLVITENFITLRSLYLQLRQLELVGQCREQLCKLCQP